MAIANFGMDLRPTSNVVKTDDQLRLEMQQQMAALVAQRPQYEAASSAALDALGAARVQQARAQGFNVGDEYADIVRQAARQQGAGFSSAASDYSSDIGDAARLFGGQYTAAAGALQGINTTLGRLPQQFDDTVKARQDAQQSQQSAYDTSTLGGGISGGVLPGIANQGTLDPTQQASWNTPWMQPGFGNPGSLGGLGGYKPQAGQQQQQQGGWGGVFGQKNPWSLA